MLVAPAFLYAVAVVMWLSQGQDIEFARELAPVSFAALCVHLFAAGEVGGPELIIERRGRGGGRGADPEKAREMRERWSSHWPTSGALVNGGRWAGGGGRVRRSYWCAFVVCARACTGKESC